MKKLIVMRGTPGSGKSTLAKEILKETLLQGFSCSIRSTDDQFYDETGFYNFDRSKLGTFHNRNLQWAIDDMKKNINVIIIDNTNIKLKDYKGYVLQAEKFGYEVEEKKLSTSLELCLERNSKRPSDRKVPDDIVTRMHNELHK